MPSSLAGFFYEHWVPTAMACSDKPRNATRIFISIFFEQTLTVIPSLGIFRGLSFSLLGAARRHCLPLAVVTILVALVCLPSCRRLVCLVIFFFLLSFTGGGTATASELSLLLFVAGSLSR